MYASNALQACDLRRLDIVVFHFSDQRFEVWRTIGCKPTRIASRDAVNIPSKAHFLSVVREMGRSAEPPLPNTCEEFRFLEGAWAYQYV